LELGDEVQRIAFVRLDDLAVLTTSVRLAVARSRWGGQADEGVAAEALAADHRFQQEGVLAGVLALGQLQVQRQRGFQIGEASAIRGMRL
jgi:hypothetical protein